MTVEVYSESSQGVRANNVQQLSFDLDVAPLHPWDIPSSTDDSQANGEYGWPSQLPLPLEEFRRERLVHISLITGQEIGYAPSANQEEIYYQASAHMASPETRRAHTIGFLAAYFAASYRVDSDVYPIIEAAPEIGMLQALGCALEAEYTLSEDDITLAASLQVDYINHGLLLKEYQRSVYNTPGTNSLFDVMARRIRLHAYLWDDDRHRLHEVLAEACEALTQYVRDVRPSPDTFKRYEGDVEIGPLLSAYIGLRKAILLTHRESIMASEPALRQLLREQSAKTLRQDRLLHSDNATPLT